MSFVTEATLTRHPSQGAATIGQWYMPGFNCYTLEDQVREVPGRPVTEWKVPGATAIPRGRYKVVIDWSNRFKRNMPHILGVEGFDGIRVHSGATAADTEGCVCVGDRVGADGASISGGLARHVFDDFFLCLQQALTKGEVYVTIQ